MSKLFNPIKEAHDGGCRIVFVCKDAAGFYVLKPATGYRSKHFATARQCTPVMAAQVACTHSHAFYNDGDRPADGEKYEAEATAPVVVADEKKAVAKNDPVTKKTKGN